LWFRSFNAPVLTCVFHRSTLRHPNVVVFYGACTAVPNICIVTEWISKGSLRVVLEDRSVCKPLLLRVVLLR
jgi:hypothetical protein